MLMMERLIDSDFTSLQNPEMHNEIGAAKICGSVVSQCEYLSRVIGDSSS